MITWLGRFGAMLNGWLGDFPTTQATAAAAVVAMLATTVVVLATRLLDGDWTSPPEAWLAFLSVWAGINLLQFGWKRHTTKPELMPPGRTSAATPTPTV